MIKTIRNDTIWFRVWKAGSHGIPSLYVGLNNTPLFGMEY